MFQVLVLSCMDERAERALGFVEKAGGRDKFGCCNDPLKLRLAFGLVCFSWDTNTHARRAPRALGGLGALVDERAERVLEFVKRTRPTASHILTFKGSLEHSAYAEYAKASLGFWV